MQYENLAQILTPTVKRSLSDEVAEQLRDAIMHGQLAPEEPFREATLSELMGVSRGPVREALTLLETRGPCGHYPYRADLRSPALTSRTG